MSNVICYKEDTVGFINRYLELDKNWQSHKRSTSTGYKVGCRYTAGHIRLIAETPGEIISMYGLEFMNDQVYVTIQVEEARQVA